MEWSTHPDLRVSDDPAAVNVERVHRWLSEDTYWARGRSRELVESSIAGSLSFSLFRGDGEQIGFCRVVTDKATFAWLCDVYVDRKARGIGAGSFLVRCAVEHPDVKDVKRHVLATADAHTLYERFGFTRFSAAEGDRWMMRGQLT